VIVSDRENSTDRILEIQFANELPVSSGVFAALYIERALQFYENKLVVIKLRDTWRKFRIKSAGGRNGHVNQHGVVHREEKNVQIDMHIAETPGTVKALNMVRII